jgi:hypothetical protein
VGVCDQSSFYDGFIAYNTPPFTLSGISNPAILRLYDTVDNPQSPTNYERLQVDFSTTPGAVTFMTQTGGTFAGTTLGIQFNAGSASGFGYSASSNQWTFGAATQIIFNCTVYIQTGDFHTSGTSLWYWGGRSVLASPADGNLRLTNNAQTDFGLLQLGGTSASFPAIKRSAATAQCRLADDSAFASFSVADIYTNDASFMHRSSITLNNGAGASAATFTNAPAAGNPTKWIPIDDNGTTRYIPAF